MNKKIEGINRGWFPVYWELFNDDNIDYKEVFFFHYLSEVFPILKDSTSIDGVLYKRLANSMIQEKFGVDDGTITKWFKALEDNGYIKVWRPNNNKKGIRYYTITLEIENSLSSGYYDRSEERPSKCYTSRLDNRYEQRYTDRSEKSRTKETKETNDIKELEDTIIYNEEQACRVIDYLNQQNGSNYKYTESNLKHIKDRIEEGFTFEEFQKVIDNQIDEWEYTEYDKYIRPSTLFGENFESYLNKKT